MVTHELLIRAWLIASKSLAFEVVAPFKLQHKAAEIECVAFLPQFGSANGMVIGVSGAPDFKTNSRLIESAIEARLFYSFINPDVYSTFNERLFKETLKDWGFFGSAHSRPPFLK